MSPARPALIRLVSSRYRELQGLVTMMDAVWPLYMGALMVAATRLDGPYITPFVFALSAVPLVVVPIVHVCWLRPRILAYYRSRFRRVEGPSPFRGPTTMVQGVLVAAILAEAHNVAWLSVTVVLAAVGRLARLAVPMALAAGCRRGHVDGCRDEPDAVVSRGAAASRSLGARGR